MELHLTATGRHLPPEVNTLYRLQRVKG